jgi:hypothetical protein
MNIVSIRSKILIKYRIEIFKIANTENSEHKGSKIKQLQINL